MSRSLRTLSLLLLLMVSMSLANYAQDWRTYVQNAVRFSQEYPREMVYLHLDQNAYIEGETLWWKAYVVQAATLRPSVGISRVLYVELIDANGNTIVRQQAKIDAQGQAQGNIPLVLPIRSDYYEVRAYTRAMLNWEKGDDTSFYFTRVVPVFATEQERIVAPTADLEARGKKEQRAASSTPTITLTNDLTDEGLPMLSISGKSGAYGLLVTCRDVPCYFDSFTLEDDEVLAYEFANGDLHAGTNVVDVFDASGVNMARCTLWCEADVAQSMKVEVLQNAVQYDAFSPVALEIYVTDAEGNPAPEGTTFSLAVRDDEGELVATPASGDMQQQFLLPDETTTLQEYIGVDTFRVRQPIEEGITLIGHATHDNNHKTAYPNLGIHMSMYSQSGMSLTADGVTDANGDFAFTAKEDFYGDFIAQVTTFNPSNDKKHWARLAFDRWYAPACRRLTEEEVTLVPPVYLTEETAMDVPTFEWTDTIPRYMKLRELREAEVKAKHKYRGLIGGRYTYQGGEKAGMRRADRYVDIMRAVEMRKDRGEGECTIWDLLRQELPDFVAMDIPAEDAKNGTQEGDGIKVNEKLPLDSALYYTIYIDGVRTLIFLDNKLQIRSNDITQSGNSVEISDASMSDLFKSAIVMNDMSDYLRFVPLETRQSILSSGKKLCALFLYSRDDWFRYKTRKGVDKRVIQGYSPSAYEVFPLPQYTGIDMPTSDDQRRTLYWQPTVACDKQGKATAVFFTNSHDVQRLRISLRGVTPDGRFIEFDR